MDLAKYLAVLVLFFFDGGETGGHGEKHHTHVKVHIPEFIHHDHHKKVITIHHHHHKPKKEHHHHHHHHHKPHIPYGHHYHHTHKKTHTVLKGTETKNHGHHGHHEHHGHHRHHGHHGHHGHQEHGHHGHHHHDTPSYSYEPSSVPSYEDDYASSGPSVPSYSPIIIQSPHVHGIQHTVKQVKVFDSLPGGLPSSGKSHGYQVTEEDEGDEGEDHFTPLEGIQEAYPGTYGFISGVSSDPVTSHDPFAQLSSHSSVQSPSSDLFANSPLPTSVSDVETFTGSAHNNPFASLGPTQSALPSAQSTPEFSVSFHGDDGGFDNPANSFAGDIDGTNLLLSDDKSISEDVPVSFQREAGVQESIATGGVETVTY